MYVAVFVIISVQASDYNKHPLKCAIDHLLGSITQGSIVNFSSKTIGCFYFCGIVLILFEKMNWTVKIMIHYFCGKKWPRAFYAYYLDGDAISIISVDKKSFFVHKFNYVLSI